MNRKLLLVGLVMALMLCGCQKSPDSGAVISRNDGAFDANVIVSAGQHHDPEATQAARYSNRFSTTDGSVEFRFAIDESVTAADMPVLEAVPHFLTVDDARRVGQVLFDNSVFMNLNLRSWRITPKTKYRKKSTVGHRTLLLLRSGRCLAMSRPPIYAEP